MKEDDSIKSLFAARLGDYEAEVPPGIWAGIESCLAAPAFSAASAGGEAARKGLSLGKSILFSALSVAAVGSITYFTLIRQPQPPAEPTPPQEQITVQPPQEPAPIAEEPIVAHIRKYAPQPEPEPLPAPEAAVEEEVAEQIIPVYDIEDQMEEIGGAPFVSSYEAMADAPIIDFNPSMSIYAARNNSQGGYEAKNGKYYLALEADGLIPFNSAHKQTGANTRHEYDAPVSFGIDGGMRLNDVWSLQAGLRVAYLKTKEIETPQQLLQKTYRQYYLEIPVVARYRLGHWENIGFDAGAGLKAGVKLNNSVASDKQPVRMSALANAGADYKIYEKLYFYTQLGITYCVLHGKAIPVIYDQNPFSVDLNFGFRYDF
jgi:opacity protein-like surface antigen